MRYDVHRFMRVRVKIVGVEAESQEEAIRKAKERTFNLEEIADRGWKRLADIAEDDAEYFLVDEQGDNEHKRSAWWREDCDQIVPSPIGACESCGAVKQNRSSPPV